MVSENSYWRLAVYPFAHCGLLDFAAMGLGLVAQADYLHRARLSERHLLILLSLGAAMAVAFVAAQRRPAGGLTTFAYALLGANAMRAFSPRGKPCELFMESITLTVQLLAWVWVDLVGGLPLDSGVDTLRPSWAAHIGAFCGGAVAGIGLGTSSLLSVHGASEARASAGARPPRTARPVRSLCRAWLAARRRG